MNRAEIKERLATAGAQFDGHVTHGSLEAQMKVVDELIAEFMERQTQTIPLSRQIPCAEDIEPK